MAHDDLIIRTYVPTDWPGICQVHDAARPLELLAGGVDHRAFRPMVEAAEADEFFASQTLVALSQGQVVGFVSWNGSYLTWLYVAPTYHRRGIGGRLLAEAMTQIGPQAWTNMISANAPALALYRKGGFEVVWDKPGNCEGFPCRAMRLALPTSPMRDPDARRTLE